MGILKIILNYKGVYTAFRLGIRPSNYSTHDTEK